MRHNKSKGYFSREDMQDKTGDCQSMLDQSSKVQKRYTYSVIQQRFNRKLLEDAQEANGRLLEECLASIEVIPKMEEEFETLMQEQNCAEKARDEALEEVKKLREENEILRKHAATTGVGATAELACAEKLHTCAKKLEASFLVSNSDKAQIEALAATIPKSNKTIKLVEIRATASKEWSGKTSQDRDEWTNRVEKLQGEVNHLKQIAQCLVQEKGLKEGDFDILSEEMEVIIQYLNDMELERQLVELAEREKFEEGVQRGFEEAVNKQVEQSMVDNEAWKHVDDSGQVLS